MSLQTYIGTKIIQAEPRAKDYGPLESYGEAGYNVVYPDGYTSWSPAAAFEEAYRETSGLPFGHAIEALKKGKRVARAGWNGKGMWIMLVPGTPGVQMREGTPYHAAGIEVSDILPHIDMWTVNADGRRAMLPGWVASQTDMLSDDWQVIV